MGIGRSTFYDTADVRSSDVTVVAEMKAICDEFEAYGYRRVGAELRHRGMVVNAKKVRRLMREHALNPKRRRRFAILGASASWGKFAPKARLTPKRRTRAPSDARQKCSPQTLRASPGTSGRLRELRSGAPARWS